jgi:hypothetical protein
MTLLVQVRRVERGWKLQLHRLLRLCVQPLVMSV